MGVMTAGLSALQTMSILVAAPFSVVMVLACASTLKALHREHRARLRAEDKIIQRELREMVKDHVAEATSLTSSQDGPSASGPQRQLRFRRRST